MTPLASHSCGYVSRAKTPAFAAKGLRNHSCARYQVLADRRARGEAIRAGVDRTPKPCLHKRAQHVHGTHACYVLDRCHCRACANASSEYERRRTRQRAYGRQAYVDAAPVRAHVTALMDAGMGLKRVAVVAGVPYSVLGNLIYDTHGKRDGQHRGRSTRMRAGNAARILAVQLELAGGARVPAIGTRRRVQALVANGWSITKVGARVDMTAANFCSLLKRDQVTVATAKRVAELYDELWDAAPPESTHRDKIAASRARKYARLHGWLPPLAWDEDTIEIPDAIEHQVDDLELDEIAVERIMAGTLQLERSTPELVEAVLRLHARGLNDRAIGERVGRARDAVLKIRTRAGEKAAA